MKKVLFSFFIYILFFCNTLFGSAVLISPDNFVENEPFVFEIEALGKSVEIKDIKEIDGNIVQNLGTSRTITSINGEITSKIKKSFQLFPKDKFTIPSYEIEIDGKIYKTKEKIVNRVSVKKSISNKYELSLELEKDSLYVGEDTILKLKFKYRKDLQIVDLALVMPTFKNIWMKQLKNTKNYEEGEYNIQELEFLIFPQKSARLKLPAIRIDAKILDNQYSSYSLFSPPTKDIKIYSNTLDLDVKALPQGVNLIGEFLLKSSISKDEINANEPLSFKINIDGFGNIEDIKDIKLNINSATIYENKPLINTDIENRRYKFSYEKTFSILANSDFTIPSIELKYFDKNIGKVVSQKTQEYKIKVKNQVEEKVSVLEKAKESTLDKELKIEEKVVYKSSTKDKVIFFILGCLFTLLIIGLYYYVKNRKINDKEDLPLVKLVKKSKTKESLIKILIPYLAIDNSLDDIIFKLEKQNDIDLKIVKKEIINILESLKI